MEIQDRFDTILSSEQMSAFQSFLGTIPKASITTGSLPPSFPTTYDPRKRLCPVMDQGGCGSCVFFAVIGLLSDMVAIQRKQAVIPLSVQYPLNCVEGYNKGTAEPGDGSNVCMYGYHPKNLASFLKSLKSNTSKKHYSGTVAEKCVPYTVPNMQFCQQSRLHNSQIYGLGISGGLVLLIVLLRILFLGKSSLVFNRRLDMGLFFFLFLMVFFILLSVILAVTKYGKTKDLTIVSSLDASQKLNAKRIFIMAPITILLTLIAFFHAMFYHNSTKHIYLRNILFILIFMMLPITLVATIWLDYIFLKSIAMIELQDMQMTFDKNECGNKCTDGSQITERYYVKEFYQLDFPVDTPLETKKNRLKHMLQTIGPIGVSMMIRGSMAKDDMFTPFATVYDPQTKGDRIVGGHAFCIIGWHKDAWIIRNSWGSCWADSGYCYWKMGSDNIEDNCFYLTAE